MIKDTINNLLNNFKLGKEQEEYDIVHSEIEKAIVFRGTNLIILICAIILASVGLNMNSPAVIIGAMLISPLMGPINGMGYSIATYDFELFKMAIRNFSFAVVVSLITSTLYFFISPVSTAHSELLARTSPTIYDVFIAVFGGIAGILAISSKLKGNVIPGVAIATALMPPICTAGYGLATFHLDFFFGALYLFTINTVFIAVAAMVVAQLLKFPIRTILDPDKAKHVNRIISLTIIIVTVPSIIFGYKLVQNERFTENSKLFINQVSVQENSYLLENKVDPQNRTIHLIYSGYGVSENNRKKILLYAMEHKLDTTKISITNGTDLSILEQQKQTMLTETEKLTNKINATTFNLMKKEAEIDSIKQIPIKGKTLLNEISAIYPEIISCSYSETILYPDTITRPLIIFSTKKKINKKDKQKIVQWTKKRINSENTKILFE